MSARDPKPRPEGLDRETRARALASDLRALEDVEFITMTHEYNLLVEWFGWSIPPEILRTVARHDARLWQHDEETAHVFTPYSVE